MKLALTGHLPGKRLDEIASFEAMIVILKAAQEEGDIEVISGGADGADRLWARAAYALKIPYTIYVPKGYQERYNHGEWFTHMLVKAQDVVWTQKGENFYPALNFKRNQQMVDAADRMVICSYKEPLALVREDKRGGTRDCVERVFKSNKPFYWIDSLNGGYTFYPKSEQGKLI